ncbi:MAG: GNAT family N-acetyltransferase [Bacteroidaceae bacterium]|nr:GNAT family N-acetyltransferase [Bacteroidaceae bacterium]
MTTNIRTANPEDAYAVASLIIEAMSEECCTYFIGPDHTMTDFRLFMAALVGREDTQYSWKNTLVAVAEDRIAGIAVSYDGMLLRQLRRPFLAGMLRVFNKDWNDMDDETQAGELYLDSFAVLAEYRRQGIGRQLLKATWLKAQKMKLPCVGLLVDEDNRPALRYYKKLGFAHVDDNTWGGHRMKHLQLPVRHQHLPFSARE